jgi:hypothetical protein
VKTCQLIALLRQADPGEQEQVCVNGHQAIFDVQSMPAYYDGQLSYFTWKGSPNCQPTGAVLRRDGKRIDIVSMTIEDYALEYWWDGLEFPIKVIGDTPDKRYEKFFAEKREKGFKEGQNE